MRIGSIKGINSFNRPSSLGRAVPKDIGGKSPGNMKGLSGAVIDRRKGTILGETSIDANKRIVVDQTEQVSESDWLTQLLSWIQGMFR